MSCHFTHAWARSFPAVIEVEPLARSGRLPEIHAEAGDDGAGRTAGLNQGRGEGGAMGTGLLARCRFLNRVYPQLAPEDMRPHDS